MKVVWTASAQRDRLDVMDYIAADSPRAAVRIDELFSEAAASLAVTGTRELLPHENYRLVYEIEGDTVWVPTLLHVVRLWPPLRD